MYGKALTVLRNANKQTKKTDNKYKKSKRYFEISAADINKIIVGHHGKFYTNIEISDEIDVFLHSRIKENDLTFKKILPKNKTCLYMHRCTTDTHKHKTLVFAIDFVSKLHQNFNTDLSSTLHKI